MKIVFKYFLCLMLLCLALGNAPSAIAEMHSPDTAGDSTDNTDNIQAYELDNGMQVLLVPKPGVSITLVDIWVGVGSIDETEANNGISHFFEHMVFKGTDTRPKTVDLEIESLGGSTNAATSLDWTHYYINVPSEHSVQALEILADITMNPNFPEDEILAEKNVVLRERDQRDDNPASAIYKQFFQEFYQEHPYRLPVIGTAEGLDPLTRDDFMAFLHKHYVPANMTLVVVGDFDASEMSASIEGTFGQMEAVAYQEVEHPTDEPLTEIVSSEQQRDIVQSYMIMGWPGPTIADVDEIYAMDLLLSILSYGRGSRFYKNIQKDLGIVTAVSSEYYTTQGPSIFYVYAQFPPEHKALIRDAMLDELADILAGNISEAELERAKTIILSNIDLGRETNAGMASALGFYATVAGDYQFALEYGDNLQAATVDDVVAVAQKYIDLDAYMELTFVPDWYEAEEPAEDDTSDANEVLVLDNGLKLILREDDSTNVVAIQSFVGTGSSVENAGNAGISMLTQSLLMRGTESQSEAEIFEELENMGASMGQSILPDMGNLSLTATGETWEDALPVYLDVLLDPALSEAEFLIVQDEMIRGVTGQGDNNWAVIFNNFQTELYGPDGYGVAPEGMPESLETLSTEDVQAFYETYYVPNNMVISAVGNFDATRLKARLEGRLGTLPMGAEDLQPPRVEIALAENSEVFAEKDTNLAWIILGYPAPSVDSPDYPAAKVLNGILGTGFTSRLFRTLREQQGLAYSTGAGFPSRKSDSFLYTYIIALPENADYAVEGILGIVADIQENGVGEAELEKAKNKAIGDYVRAHETAERRAWYLAWYEVLGAGVALDADYPDLLREVKSEDIQRVAGDYLNTYVLSSLGDAPGDGVQAVEDESDGSVADEAEGSTTDEAVSDEGASDDGTEAATEDDAATSDDATSDEAEGSTADEAVSDGGASDDGYEAATEDDDATSDDATSDETEGSTADEAVSDGGASDDGYEAATEEDDATSDDGASADLDPDAASDEAESSTADEAVSDDGASDESASDDGTANTVDEKQSSARMDILTTATLKGDFQILTGAVFDADLVDVLQGPGPYTLLAPPDESFDGSSSEMDNEAAAMLVLQHGLLGRLTLDDLYAMDGETVTTLLGQALTVTVQENVVMIGDVTIIAGDIPASNGMIHVVDGVLATDR